MAYHLANGRPNGHSDPDEPPQLPDDRPRRSGLHPISLLPTLLTLGNLLCGFGAVFFASRTPEHDLHIGPKLLTPLTFAASLIFLGMVFDGLDGWIARLTRSVSDLGEQLDSMADMVTFGVAPAFLAVQLIGVESPFISAEGDQLFDRAVVVIACIYVACAALRLARFNTERVRVAKSEHSSFVGLPSPGAAGTVASLALLHQHFLVAGELTDWPIRIAAFGMVAIMLLAAFAMVSRFRYVHLVNRYLSGRVGFGTITKIVIVLLAMFISLQEVLAAGFVLYALSAPCQWVWRKISGAMPRVGQPSTP